MDLTKYTEAFKNLPDGVKAAEVYAIKRSSFTASVLSGELNEYSIEENAGVCVRADCGKMGYVCSKNPDDSASKLVEVAAQNAMYIESEDEDSLFEGAAASEYPKLKGVDERLVKADAEDKLKVLFDLEKAGLAVDSRIERLADCVISTGVFETGIANSLGMAQTQSSGFVLGYVDAVATIDGETKDGLGWRAAHCLEELDIEAIAKDAAEDLFSKFNAKPVASGDYGAVLSNVAVHDLLGVFSKMFSAEQAQNGLSLLENKEGETIASDVVTIADDPLCEQSLVKSAFDDEGVPAKKTVVVENGVLKTLLHNRKTAKKAGVESTGNAGKSGLSGAVEVQPTNFMMLPGEKTQAELLEKLGDGILITEVSGLHAGCNAVSGAFSALARGYTVENGKKGRPVDQITVSGNFLELLKDVTDVANDLRFDFPSNSCHAAPSVLVKKIKVAGE